MKNTINIDTKTFVRFWLVIVGLGLFAIFISKAWTALIIILLSVFLALALKPLAKKINKIDKKHDRNSLSSILSVVLIVTLVVGVVVVIGPIVVNEVSKFAANAPQMVDEFSSKVNLDALGRNFGISDLRQQVISNVSNWKNSIMGDLGTFAVSGISTVVGIATGSILVIVLTILFMLQGPDLLKKLWTSLDRRKGAKSVEVWSHVASRMANVVSKYVSGQALVAICDGIMTMLIVFMVSLVFNVPMSFVLPLGLFAAVMYMIPMFGPMINCVIAALLIALNSIWGAMAYVVLYLIYEQIANNMIAPKIQGKGMGLSPLVILVSITIGTYAFGIIGTFVAIPVAGCIKVLIEEYPKIKKLSE